LEDAEKAQARIRCEMESGRPQAIGCHRRHTASAAPAPGGERAPFGAGGSRGPQRGGRRPPPDERSMRACRAGPRRLASPGPHSLPPPPPSTSWPPSTSAAPPPRRLVPLLLCLLPAGSLCRGNYELGFFTRGSAIQPTGAPPLALLPEISRYLAVVFPPGPGASAMSNDLGVSNFALSQSSCSGLP
jgi:hypothetical protein